MNEIADRVYAEIRSLVGENAPFEIPPPVFQMMLGEFLAYEKGVSLKIAYTIQKEFCGPNGTLQGGIIGAAFDNTYGPLSWLSARAPCTTLTLSTSFVRPLMARDEKVIIEARVTTKTARFLFLEGLATKPDGTLCARSSSEMVILPVAKMARLGGRES